MSIRRTSRLIVAGVLLVSLVTLGSALRAAQLRQWEAAVYEERVELLKMADLLAAGSDRLTGAVRGYAATGEREYLDDFHQELKEARTRDVAMDRLQQMGASGDEMALFEEAKRNSDALVGLENQALEAVARRDLGEAVRLVYGSAYTQAKRSIMDPLRRGRAALEARLSLEAAELERQASQATQVSLSSLALNVVGVLAALTLFYNRRLVEPLVSLSRSLQQLASGVAGIRVGYTRDATELGELARALESYQQQVEHAESQRWVKARAAEIAEKVDGRETAEDFGSQLLSGLVPLLAGGYGGFYLHDEATGRYPFAAGYAQAESGEVTGLCQQAAADRSVILLRELPAGYLKIRSGVGEAYPCLVAMAPLTLGERVLALLEVACFAELSPQQLQLLEEVRAMAALKLEVLIRNQRTRDLLERVRASDERMRRANFLSDIALELTGCGYWHVDYSDPDFYWQSERAVRIVGEEPREDGRYHLHDEWFARLVEADPEIAAKTAEVYQKAVSGTSDGYDATYKYKRPCDGKVVWLHAAGKLERASDGSVTHMYGVYQDITEFKRLEAELLKRDPH